MSASGPDPRYFKDGNGLKPRLRLRLRHPVYALRFTPLQRLRIRWNDRRYRHRAMFVVNASTPEHAPRLCPACACGWHNSCTNCDGKGCDCRCRKPVGVSS